MDHSVLPHANDVARERVACLVPSPNYRCMPRPHVQLIPGFVYRVPQYDYNNFQKNIKNIMHILGHAQQQQQQQHENNRIERKRN